MHMSFYEEIHGSYEDIFPAGEAQVSFLARVLSGGGASKVLDAACGTGAYARALAQQGFEVTGIDYEEAMVREARKRGAKSKYARRLHFRRGDMRDLESFAGRFDALLCLGNSLPHLLEDEEIQSFFRGGRKALRKEGGLLILQTVNYDRVLGKEDYHLPPIERKDKGLRFTRRYEPRLDGLLDFHTELRLERGGETLSRRNRVPLRPLTRKELESFLEDSGFAAPSFYGSFRFGPWDREGPATILVAGRGAS